MTGGGVGQAGGIVAEQEDVVLAAVGVDAALVDAAADVGERVLVVADAHADVLGAERPDAELDGVVLQRGGAEAALPGQDVRGGGGGGGHPGQGTHRRSRGTWPGAAVGPATTGGRRNRSGHDEAMRAGAGTPAADC